MLLHYECVADDEPADLACAGADLVKLRVAHEPPHQTT